MSMTMEDDINKSTAKRKGALAMEIIQGKPTSIHHKRVYRVMRDAGWLLFRQGQKPLDSRKHEGQVAVKQTPHAGVRMGWNNLVTTVNASGWRLRWTAATERSCAG